jgi:hypothetical protein
MGFLFMSNIELGVQLPLSLFDRVNEILGTVRLDRYICLIHAIIPSIWKKISGNSSSGATIYFILLSYINM